MSLTDNAKITALKMLADGSGLDEVVIALNTTKAAILSAVTAHGYPKPASMKRAVDILERNRAAELATIPTGIRDRGTETQVATGPETPARPTESPRTPPAGGGWARKALPHAGDPPSRSPHATPEGAREVGLQVIDRMRQATGQTIAETPRDMPRHQMPEPLPEEPLDHIEDAQLARLRTLINRAKAIDTPKIRRTLEQALDKLTVLQGLVDEHDAAEQARTQAAEERRRAAEQVAQLEQQLAEARAKLRAAGGVQTTRPRTVPAGTGEAYLCRYADCDTSDREYGRTQDRGRHEKLVHGAVWTDREEQHS